MQLVASRLELPSMATKAKVQSVVCKLECLLLFEMHVVLYNIFHKAVVQINKKTEIHYDLR